jgi:hypothetical protein
MDLETGSDVRSNINALSNAKRSLHLQVELLAKAFGFEKLPKRESQGFPTKLEFCRRCGLTAPKVLRKLNSIRNLAEHEYYVPNRAEVEDFIDVVELFIYATERFLKHFPTDLEWTWSEKVSADLPDITGVEFPPGGGVIYLIVPGLMQQETPTADHTEWLRTISIQIHVTDGDPYFRWVSFLVKNC